MLWLLEELEIKYNVVLYTRNPKTQRAPPSLQSISATGKSPVLVTPEGRTITESSAIVAYLLRTYDTSSRFAASDYIRDELLTSFAGATLGPINAIELLFDLLAKNTPWPLVYITRQMRKAIQNFFTGPELKKSMAYLEKELGEEEWFNGKELGRSDIMLNFPLDTIAHRKWIDLEQYPKLDAWRQRIVERPAWKRGLERGNGYDLSKW